MNNLQRPLVWLSLFSICSAANAGSVYFTESDPVTTHMGESFSLQVRGRDFPVGVDGGGLDIRFDNVLLQVESITVDPVWDFLSSNGSIDNGQGLVTDIYFNNSSMSGVSGDFPILSIRLSVVGTGAGFVNLEPNLMFPIAGGGEQLPADFSQLDVLTSVPEPAIALSMMVGLIVLPFLLWRSPRGAVRRLVFPWPRRSTPVHI